MSHTLGHHRWAPVLSVSLAAAAAGALAGLPSPARAASIPVCSASQLVTTIRQLPGGGTAGTFFEQLRFTNLGRECTLHGYPGVSAVALGGRQVGKAAVRRSGSEKTVTLRAVSADSAATATARIGFVDTGALGSGCGPRLAAGLRVYAPNTASAAYVPYVFDACTGGSQAFLEISPITEVPG